MTSIVASLAGSSRDILNAQRLRWHVYANEEGMIPIARSQSAARDVDELDFSPNTVHVLVHAATELVGTVRLFTRRSDKLSRSHGLGALFDLSHSHAARVSLGEVSRFCIRREWRHSGVFVALARALLAESRSLGLTHWFAAANTQTDDAGDAAIIYASMERRNLVSREFVAAARSRVAAPRTPKRPLYSDKERQAAAHTLSREQSALKLPRVLSLFTARLGAACIGPPVYDPYFGVFGLPVVSALDGSWSRAFSDGDGHGRPG